VKVGDLVQYDRHLTDLNSWDADAFGIVIATHDESQAFNQICQVCKVLWTSGCESGMSFNYYKHQLNKVSQ